MAKFDIANTASSDLTNNVANLSPESMNTDGPTGSELIWQNVDWSKYWGYFNTVPELKSAMLMKSCWVVGKGYTCDARTEAILDHVSGMGKDNFQDILFNMDMISRLAGDSFAEIIRDEKTGILLNLKPLDPGSIQIVVDKRGIIKEYRQTSKVSDNIVKFKPNEIFHLSHNRLADSIHGCSDVVAIEKTILAEYENFEDMKKIMHRQARPLIMFKLKTDNSAKIAAFVKKMDEACNKGENIYIPDDENTVSYEVVQISIGDIIMSWRTDIRNKFYRTLGIPQIVFGSSGATESGSKIEYLAHEQVFEHDQKFLEGQIWNQLYLKINLISPVSLLPPMHEDQQKDGKANMMSLQKNDVQAGVGE
jgi:hypothetical protein